MSKFFLATVLCLLFIAPSVLCQDISIESLVIYNKWRFNNKRIYLNDDEQIYRQTVFFENLKKIQEHSKNTDATYKIGLNKFSDMTTEEFTSKILSKRIDSESSGRNLQADPYATYQTNYSLPKPAVSVDWRTRGILTPVKDQGSCGSCWTFSVIGVLEAFVKKRHNVIQVLSEQQLVDCATESRRTNGCNGGFQVDGIVYAIKNGVAKQSDYPYVGYQNSCKVTPSTKRGIYPKKYQQVPATSEGLKAALSLSPVIATVNASTWQNYQSGVFNGCDKIRFEQLNHAIIAVGYDAQGNWIIRNSWSTSWGESGYIRLAAGETCGILLDNQIITE